MPPEGCRARSAGTRGRAEGRGGRGPSSVGAALSAVLNRAAMLLPAEPGPRRALGELPVRLSGASAQGHGRGVLSPTAFM